MNNESTVMSPSNSRRATLFDLVEKPIPGAAKLALILYVVIYRILSPPISAIIAGEQIENAIPRILLGSALEVLLVCPLLFGKRVGWFHPLSFPFLLSVAFAVVFSPTHLILPFVSSAELYLGRALSWSVFLKGLSPAEYSGYEAMLSFATILFWLAVFAGFSVAERSRSRIAPPIADGRQVARVVMVWVALVLVFAALFFASRGGIQGQIVSFRQGRYVTQQGLGFASVIVKSAGIALLLWLASDPKGFKNPFFWLLTGILVPTFFLIDGSRSGVMLLLLSFAIMASLRLGKLPIGAAMPLAIFAFLVFGALGMVRQDYHSTTVDASSLSLSNIPEWVEASRAETIKRDAEEGDLAAVVAANKRGLLAGRSYVAVAAFPIPRAIWPEKPKNVFTYTAWVAFLGNEITTSAPSIWGIPTGPVAEAYWNFSWFGPPLIGFGVGAFFGWLVALFRRNPQVGWVCALYIVSLLYFTGGSRAALYWVQYVAVIAVIMMIARLVPNDAPRASLRALPRHSRTPA